LPLLITRKRSQDLDQPFWRRVRWWLYLVTIPAAAVIAVPGSSHIQQFQEELDQVADDALSREEAEVTSLDEAHHGHGDVSLYQCEDLDVMDGCSQVETWTGINDWYGEEETKALAIRTEDSPLTPRHLLREDSDEEHISHTVTLVTPDGEYDP